MPALTPEQVARSAFDKWHRENDHLLDTYNFVDDCMFSAYQAGGVFALQQPVQTDRRIAWFDDLTKRAEAMGFVSIEDALDGFDATRKAAEDRAMQPVQAVPDGQRWKMILKLLSTFKLDYYFLEGRSEEEITSAIDEEISNGKTIEAAPGEPGQ